MKREINKKIKTICDEVGTAAAAERLESLTNQLGEDYDARVKAGMSELDAYRDVMRNIDLIEKTLRELPETEEKADSGEPDSTVFYKRGGGGKRRAGEKKSEKSSNKKLKKLLSALSTCMWLCATAVFLLSFGRISIAVSWLIFLWATIGQTIINMVIDVNRGKSEKKVYRSGLRTITWVGSVMAFFITIYAGRITLFPAAAVSFLGAAVISTVIGVIFDD